MWRHLVLIGMTLRQSDSDLMAGSRISKRKSSVKETVMKTAKAKRLSKPYTQDHTTSHNVYSKQRVGFSKVYTQKALSSGVCPNRTLNP